MQFKLLLLTVSIFLISSCGGELNSTSDPFLLIEHGEVDFLEKALKEGLDPNLKNTKGDTLLIHALNNSLRVVDSVRILLKYGADPDLYEPGMDPPIIVAVIWCNEKSVDDLLNSGVNLHVRGSDGRSVIESVGRCGKFEN